MYREYPRACVQALAAPVAHHVPPPARALRLAVDAFQATFVFNIEQLPSGVADGLTFALHNDARGVGACGGLGGALGFATGPPVQNAANVAGINNSVGLRFDTYANGRTQSTLGLVNVSGVTDSGEYNVSSVFNW